MIKLLFSTLILSALVSVTSFAQSERQIEKEIFKLINEHRTKLGLAALEENKVITKAAAEHSQNMARHKIKAGHGGFDERMDGIIKQIAGVKATAENVAYGSKDAGAVVKLWLDSKGHRKNIEGDYQLTGIAVERDRHGVLYFTQIFIRKK